MNIAEKLLARSSKDTGKFEIDFYRDEDAKLEEIGVSCIINIVKGVTFLQGDSKNV